MNSWANRPAVPGGGGGEGQGGGAANDGHRVRLRATKRTIDVMVFRSCERQVGGLAKFRV